MKYGQINLLTKDYNNMPPKRAYKKRAMKRVPRGIGGARRRMLYNPQPVFTETYKLAHPLSFGNPSPVGGIGFLLSATMDGLTQLGQYSNLYTKYKILKCSFTLLPNFVASDQNGALYNLSQGTMSVAQTRIVYSYNDSPAAAGPASEAEALEENGCKIKMLTNKLVIPCRPVPNTLDANGVALTQRGKYINFTTGGAPNIVHYGVNGWLKQLYNNQPQFLNDIDVYVKITFQLSDPR